MNMNGWCWFFFFSPPQEIIKSKPGRIERAEKETKEWWISRVYYSFSNASHNLCESQEKKYKPNPPTLAASPVNKRNVMNSSTSLPNQLQAEAAFSGFASSFSFSPLQQIRFLLEVVPSVFLCTTGFRFPLYDFCLFLHSPPGFKSFFTALSASVFYTFKSQFFESVT